MRAEITRSVPGTSSAGRAAARAVARHVVHLAVQAGVEPVAGAARRRAGRCRRCRPAGSRARGPSSLILRCERCEVDAAWTFVPRPVEWRGQYNARACQPHSRAGSTLPSRCATSTAAPSSACGIPGYALMKRAGQAALTRCAPALAGGPSLAVLLRARQQRRRRLRARAVGARAGPARPRSCALDRSAATAAAMRASACDGFRRGRRPAQPLAPRACSHGDVIVDALLGTGLDARRSRARRRPASRPINAARPAGRRGGHALGTARRYRCRARRAPCAPTLTVTFIGRKLGCYVGAGPDHAGRLVFDDLGVPRQTYSRTCRPLRACSDESTSRPRCRGAAHGAQGRHGHVLVIGGGPGHAAAPCASPARRRCARAPAWSPSPRIRDNIGDRRRAAGVHVASRLARPRDLGRGARARHGRRRRAGPRAGVLGAASCSTRRSPRGQPLVVDADALNLLARRTAPRDRLDPDAASGRSGAAARRPRAPRCRPIACGRARAAGALRRPPWC